ncbi:hypothetical protein AKO1_006988 [Acrasis kona]|uniref:DJ-1/PfpI domain-containing protein n=1 Tax=Acrasis kona TaxID=1008807 RepID=A0AAW2YU71_9EUKA
MRVGLVLLIAVIATTIASKKLASHHANAEQRILLVVTSHEDLGTSGKKTGYYLPEAAHPHHVFTNAGLKVDYASPKGGKSPLDPYSVQDYKDDKISVDFLNNASVQKQLSNTIKISDVNPNKYSAIFFVGGHGPMYDLPTDVAVQQLTRTFYESNKIVAAVCHGPAGLLNVRLSNGKNLIDGKRVAGYTNGEEEEGGTTSQMPFSLEDTLKRNGGLYTKVDNWQPHVVRDGNLFTGQNPASATGLAKIIVSALKKH